MPCCLDAGPLIHLAELELLPALGIFSSLYTTGVVMDEIRRHMDDIPIAGITIIKEIEPVDSRVKAMARIFSLDAGEISVLSLVLQSYPDAVLLSDDSAARLAADSLHIPSVGTLGCIIKAGTTGIIPREQVLSTLELVPEKSTLYLKKELLEEVLVTTRQAWGL